MKKIILFMVVICISSCRSCSTDVKEQRLEFKLNWTYYGEHAAFIVAKELGYFSKEGLDVNLVPGNGSGSTVQLVADGTFPIGYADTGTQIKLSADGFSTTNVAVFTPVSPMSLVTLSGGSLKTWEDLKGKKIGITVSDAASALFKIILGKLNLKESDIEILRIANPKGRGQALLKGRVDAFLGYHINEPHKLEHKTGRKMHWLPISDLGIRFLSSGIIVNPKFLRDKPEIVGKFVRASQKGLEYTLQNPTKAAELLDKYSDDIDKTTAEKMIRDHLSIVKSNQEPGRKAGWTSEESWDQTIDFLKSYYKFRGKIDKNAFYTNRFTE